MSDYYRIELHVIVRVDGDDDPSETARLLALRVEESPGVKHCGWSDAVYMDAAEVVEALL